MEYTGGKVTSQFEALKLLVSERMSAIAAEIVAAIAKTFIDYEAQSVRLKEENDRQRSLLDVFVNGHLPVKARVSKVAVSTPPTSNVPSSYKNGSTAADCAAKRRPADQRISSDRTGKFVFTSCDDFLAYGMNTANGECPYCVNPCAATKSHLKLKHYKEAAHFVLNGIRYFVVSCTCKERIQSTRRSHFHCAFCHKIISRKISFNKHVLIKHGISLVKNSKESEMDPSPSEEQAPLSSDSWCQKDVTLDQENQQAVMFLQMNAQQSQQKKNHADQTFYEQIKACVSSSDPSAQLHLKTRSADEKSPQSVLKSLGPKRRSSSTAVKLLPTSSAKLRPSGPYQCKACGKTFHYMYTLRTHVQAHRLEGVCGICGRRLGRGQTLLQHLQSHRRRKKCGVCGKQFSDDARLRRHSAFHRPKALSAASALG